MKRYALPALSILAGIAGFFLRQRQNQTAFDAAGLPLPMATASLLLLIVSAGVLLLCLGLALWQKKILLVSPRAESSLIHLVLTAFAGAGMGYAGVSLFQEAYFLQTMQGERDILLYVTGIACLLTAISFFAQGFLRFANRTLEDSLWYLFPGFAFCLLLMKSYQSLSTQAVLWSYVVLLLAIMSAMLSYYFLASLRFGAGKIALAYFCGALSIYLALTSLADALSLSHRVLLIAHVLYTSVALVLLEAPSTHPDDTSDIVPLKEDSHP